MIESLPVISLDEIKNRVTDDAVLKAVRGALIAQAGGDVVSPPPGQLLFNDPHGDCHIKYGYIKGADSFVVKIATGFYGNAEKGLPVTNGMMMVFDARTGFPKCLLDDRGWLTNIRTAAAGALAAQAAAPSSITGLGIIGAGEQAELQARWTAKLLGIEHITLWARRPEKAQALADKLTASGLQTDTAADIPALLSACNMVVTTTPAAEPLVMAYDVRPGTHIVAMGADSPGKVELDPALFARASAILTDSHDQCLDHGDFGHAVRADQVGENADTELGLVLNGTAVARRSQQDITIADLTGIAAEDIAVAELLTTASAPSR